MSTSSYTSSYSVVDVRKVMDQLHADMRMIAQSTGLRTQSSVDITVGDIIKFAERGYLKHVQIRLVYANGKNAQVWNYEINEDAVGWSSDHAGGNLSNVSAARMATTIYYSNSWNGLSAAQQASFRATLATGWPDSTDDLSVDHLRVEEERTYVSNSYGVKRSVHK